MKWCWNWCHKQSVIQIRKKTVPSVNFKPHVRVLVIPKIQCTYKKYIYFSIKWSMLSGRIKTDLDRLYKPTVWHTWKNMLQQSSPSCSFHKWNVFGIPSFTCPDVNSLKSFHRIRKFTVFWTVHTFIIWADKKRISKTIASIYEQKKRREKWLLRYLYQWEESWKSLIHLSSNFFNREAWMSFVTLCCILAAKNKGTISNNSFCIYNRGFRTVVARNCFQGFSKLVYLSLFCDTCVESLN